MAVADLLQVTKTEGQVGQLFIKNQCVLANGERIRLCTYVIRLSRTSAGVQHLSVIQCIIFLDLGIAVRFIHVVLRHTRSIFFYFVCVYFNDKFVEGSDSTMLSTSTNPLPCPSPSSAMNGQRCPRPRNFSVVNRSSCVPKWAIVSLRNAKSIVLRRNKHLPS